MSYNELRLFLSPEIFFSFIIFPFFVGYAGVNDLLTMRIPNMVPFVILVSFGFFSWAHETPLLEVASYYASGVLVLLVTIGLFAAGWIGGGDAKFLAATSVWFGFSDLLSFILISAILGGFLTIFILYFRRAFPIPPLCGFLLRLHDDRNGVPYGVALSIATLVTFPNTILWENILK